MGCSVTPGPLVWWISSSLVSRLLVTLSICLAVNACCPEEQGPVTDCSFSHGQDTFSCDIADRGYHFDTCPDEGISSLEDVPGPVVEGSFNIKTYFTSCPPTDDYMYNESLDASSCHTPCNHSSGSVHAGLNITFKANTWTSENLRAITISLRHGISLNVHCVTFRFKTNGLTPEALEEHEFYYDGFIGLIPGEVYTVNILTLPTTTGWDNAVTEQITIPWESCWVPDVVIHETPFAVNLTLFQDLDYGFTRFAVHLYDDPLRPITRKVDFRTADIYEIDGKNGTNILFDCIEPSTTKLNLYVASEECSYCDWHKTEVRVEGVPPKFVSCPEHDIIEEIEMAKPMIRMASVQWSPPIPIFDGRCSSGHNSSHDPEHSAFQVGTTTPIHYMAWQYSLMTVCTFNIEVRAVDSTPPNIICPDNIIMNGVPKKKTLQVSWRKPSFDDASETMMTIVTPDIPSNHTSYNFPVGVNTTVKYQIMDAYNNVAYCKFSVYVKGDTDPPQITYCPRNMNLKGRPKLRSAKILWDRPQFSDASDTIMTIVTPHMPVNETFFHFSVGENTTVKYKITDAYNNSAYCTFFVAIEETPSASPLVIALSCLAGILLIILVAVLICRKRCGWGMRITDSIEVLETADNCENDALGYTCTPVSIKDYGVPLKSLEQYASSQLSLVSIISNNLYHSQRPFEKRCQSVPDIRLHDSGFDSDEEFIPIPGHPPKSTCLESVKEEEMKCLVWRRNSIEEVSSSDRSRNSDSFSDDSPVSLESTC